MKTPLNYITLHDRPGSLLDALKVLSENSIDLRFMAAQRLDSIGFTYLLPKQVEKTLAIQGLEGEQGAINSIIMDAIPIFIDDKPGSLIKALESLAEKNINIDFCFVFSITNGRAFALIGLEASRPNVQEEAVRVLNDSGFNTSTDFIQG